MSFLLSIFSFFSVLSYQVSWIQDELYLKLGDQVSDYIYLPEAELYQDSILIEDPLMFYERGVDRTFISVIQTNLVKTYQVKYRVHFPSHNITHTQTITFHVIDDIPPTIIFVPEHKIPIGQKLPNLTEGIILYDNYDSADQLSITVDHKAVIINRVGKYPLIYRFTDASNNFITKVVYLEIYDHLPPTITLKKEMVIQYNAALRWQDFLTIVDNYDLVIDVRINDQLVDYQQLGSYPVTIEATDQSGQSSLFNTTLTIADQTKPTILLRSQIQPLGVGAELTTEQLRGFILSVSDNYDDLFADDVVITHDIETDYVGEYTIYYQLSDFSGNVTEIKYKIKVTDQEKPMIQMMSSLIFDVGGTTPFLMDHFGFSDNYTDVDALTIKLTTSYKINQVGHYPLTIEVTDAAKNKTVLNTYIQIVDRIAPVIEQTMDIIITDFMKKAYIGYFVISDNYDATASLDFYLDDSQVDYQTIGIYPVTVYLTDLSQNQTILETEIMMIDITAPHIELSQTEVYVMLGQSPIDFSQYLVDVGDNYDVLFLEDVQIEANINWQSTGIYYVTYTVDDASLNVFQITLTVKIDDVTPPTIFGSDLAIAQGSSLNMYDGMMIEGHQEIYTFPQTIDTHKPGVYRIVYIAVDQRGNQTTFERTIIIEAQQQAHLIQAYLPLAAILIFAILISYYVYKKR